MPIDPESISSVSLVTVHSLGDHSHNHPNITSPAPHLLSLYIAQLLWALSGYVLSTLLPPATLNPLKQFSFPLLHKAALPRDTSDSMSSNPRSFLTHLSLLQQLTQLPGLCAKNHSPLCIRFSFGCLGHVSTSSVGSLSQLTFKNEVHSSETSNFSIWTKISNWICNFKHSV